jgi:glycosyltransferase involved in cell wall biosynthesis
MEPRRPRIAFFLHRHGGESAQIMGGTRSVLALLSSLPRHDVLVVLNARDAVAEELARRGVRHVVIPADISWRGAGTGLRALVTRLLKAARFNREVRRLCAAEGVSVLQCDENAALFAGPGARLAGARLVVVYRNYPGIVPRMKAFYKVPMLLADRLVTAGELLREVIVTQGWPSPAPGTALIYNGIDLDGVRRALASADRGAIRAGLGIAEGEVAVGVVGSIAGYKHQLELLREVIAPRAAELRAARVRFHFLGGVKDEAYAAQCRALVEERDLADLTAWIGYVSDMTPWLVALDLLAYPAPEGPARALFEGGAFGLPAVARTTSREMVTDGESGFLRGEIADFADPILRLAADPELRRRMGTAAVRRAEERFDARRNAEEYARLYDELT